MADYSPEELAGIQALFASAQSMYPQLSWALKVPELAKVITQAAGEQWDQGRIQAALEATQWWQSRTDSARQWEQLVNTDPQTAAAKKQQVSGQISDWAAKNGIALTPDQLAEVANWSTALGFSQDQYAAYVLDHFVNGQQNFSAPVGDQLKQMASDYAVPMSDQTLGQWERNTLTGQADQATFESYLKEQAKSLFPGLTNAIDRGITVKQYVQPYQEVATQELGINPQEIDWRDPKWSAAIHQIDPKTGVPVSMSLSDWTKTLRTDPTYGFNDTQKAKEQASALGQNLAKMMGNAA